MRKSAGWRATTTPRSVTSGGGAPGGELRLGQDLLDPLEERDRARGRPAAVPRGFGPARRSRPRPPGPPATEPRRTASVDVAARLNQSWSPDRQALALGQGGHRRHGDAKLVEQDDAVDIGEGLLESPGVGLAGRRAAPARPEHARRPGKGLDARPEVLLHLGAQEARLGEGLALDPAVLAADLPPDQVPDQEEERDARRDRDADERAPEGTAGPTLARLSFAGDAPGPAIVSPGSLPRETTAPNRAESWRIA